MIPHWQPIGEAADPIERPQESSPGVEYRQIGVRLWGEGAYEREPIDGGSTRYRTLNRVELGDIIVNKIWERNGSVSVALDGLEGCYCSGELPLLRPRPERLDPKWFYWVTKTDWFWKSCDVQSRGTSGKNRIRPEKFVKVEIPLPPLDEQRRIVAKIQRLATKVEEARDCQLLAQRELGALLPACIDDVIGHRWPTVILQSAVDPNQPVTYGIVQAGPPDPDGVPYIRVSDMQSSHLTPVGMLRTSRSIADKYRRSTVRPGDVVFAIRATVGKVRMVPPELDGANLTQGTARLAPSSDAHGKYLFWSLQGSRAVDQIAEACKGSTFREITLGRLRRISIPLPPTPERERIVAYLDSLQAKINRLKALQAQTRAELDALLPTILDRAFKGEL